MQLSGWVPYYLLPLSPASVTVLSSLSAKAVAGRRAFHAPCNSGHNLHRLVFGTGR